MPDFLNPMRWLLKAEGYPPAVLFSVGLHVLVVYLMWDQDFVPDNLVDLERPEYVRAAVIQENPQKLRRLEDERQRAADAAAEQRAREQAAEQRRQEEARQQAQREQEAREQEQQRQQELERQQEAERQRLAQQDAERQRQAEAAAESERQQRLAQEEADRIARETAAREAAAQQAASDNQAISSYMAVIYDTVSNNWILPPSARNGMTAVVRLNLVPTGEIVNYTIVTSSGDTAFDRSVMQAVGQSERFPELQQMPSRIFETQFRIVDLTFRPEDLLR